MPEKRLKKTRDAYKLRCPQCGSQSFRMDSDQTYYVCNNCDEPVAYWDGRLIDDKS